MSATKEMLADLENLMALGEHVYEGLPQAHNVITSHVVAYAENEFMDTYQLDKQGLNAAYKSFLEFVRNMPKEDQRSYRAGISRSGQAIYRYYEQICKRKGLI